MKQIEADRYGNDSRGGGGIVKCAEGVGGGQCLPDHQKEGSIAGMWEQRSYQKFLFLFVFFPSS